MKRITIEMRQQNYDEISYIYERKCKFLRYGVTVKPRQKVIKKNKKHPRDLASISSGLGAIEQLPIFIGGGVALDGANNRKSWC